jgi:hypothetical protein
VYSAGLRVLKCTNMTTTRTSEAAHFIHDIMFDQFLIYVSTEHTKKEFVSDLLSDNE